MSWLQDIEEQEEYGVLMGDPRRCPYHPHVVTSSPDGMFDCDCWECEAANDREPELEIELPSPRDYLDEVSDHKALIAEYEATGNIWF